MSCVPSKRPAVMLKVLATAALILFAASPVLAQLTQADIEALRERGKKEGWTFTVGLCEANTKYSLEQLCGDIEPEGWYDKAPHTTFTATAALPSQFDWREYDGQTPIKNQGGCGSCWAFATVGCFEAVIKIRDGITVDLSEQWLVSCNRDGWGCNGGGPAHDYHQWKDDPCGDNGAVFEVNFPYAAADLDCDCPYPHEYWINGWAYVGDAYSVPPVDDIKQAIMEYGPVYVSVHVNDPWYAYSGGVFNACEDEPTNHGVNLVGWDDDYEGQGVWILRNSWGDDWGDNGYMYIPYGCSYVGRRANYVDYQLAGVFFWADTTFGWVPFDVNFDASSPLNVDTWTWDFGDGDSAFVQTPAPHTYDAPGAYDVTLQIDAGGDIRTVTKEMYIVAVADTVHGASVTGPADSDIEVTLTANNSAPIQYLKIPVEFPNDWSLMYDSFSTAGCRTNYFEIQEYLHYDPWFGKRVTLKLVSSNTGSSPDLAPGNGPVVKLYFSIPGTATDGQTAVVNLDGYDSYLPAYYGDVANYEIASIDGLITVGSGSCCLNRGDVNHDGQIDALDITYFVEWMWKGGPDIPCPEEADVDGSEQVDGLDLSYMVAYFWQSGPAPVPCN